MSPSVAVIVVNWNGGEDVLTCLASLKAVTHRPLLLLVVDNASGDGSPERIQATHPDVVLLRNPSNLGFAEGNNVGMRHALALGADYVLLLNDDTVVAPDFLSRLLESARAHPEAGFLGPKIFYHAQPDRIWMGNPVWDPVGCRFEHVGLDMTDGEAGLTTDTPGAYTCGCALLAPRRTLETVGLMDPRFFCYFEEVDWCFRGARQGLTCLYVPAAHVWHKVLPGPARRSPTLRYFRARNSMLWAARTLTRRQRLRVFLNQARDAHATLRWRAETPLDGVRRWYWNLLLLHRDPELQAWRRGIHDYLRKRFGPPPPIGRDTAQAPKDALRPAHPCGSGTDTR